MSTLTENIAKHLLAKRDQKDPVSEARRQASAGSRERDEG